MALQVRLGDPTTPGQGGGGGRRGGRANHHANVYTARTHYHTGSTSAGQVHHRVHVNTACTHQHAGGTSRGQQAGDNKQGTTSRGHQAGDNKQGTTSRGQQAGDNKQGTASRRQQAGDNKQGTTSRGQQAGDNKHATRGCTRHTPTTPPAPSARQQPSRYSVSHQLPPPPTHTHRKVQRRGSSHSARHRCMRVSVVHARVRLRAGGAWGRTRTGLTSITHRDPPLPSEEKDVAMGSGHPPPHNCTCASQRRACKAAPSIRTA